eukprot:CAMPEP_0202431006 /NCGR_PEP_ID=MMETSP1345-20130828/4392_1 /ASSEMBLY_ACC=CAM_ASM_000843 /TAXON_ID=342563 /ORGANISM="Fabrea Fabrea salina" /LENGTH=166 /DNA_ID=CAMNT_0049042589 /DNA_START=32 /DNA_END=528 /DNA_ORIENTATION=+
MSAQAGEVIFSNATLDWEIKATSIDFTLTINNETNTGIDWYAIGFRNATSDSEGFEGADFVRFNVDTGEIEDAYTPDESGDLDEDNDSIGITGTSVESEGNEIIAKWTKLVRGGYNDIDLVEGDEYDVIYGYAYNLNFDYDNPEVERVTLSEDFTNNAILAMAPIA